MENKKHVITLTIDGKKVTVPMGSTVLKAAESVGIKVPTLCSVSGLSPYGSCRLCAVEIKGKKGYPASCTTFAEEGMDVTTKTDSLTSMRATIIGLYLSDHNTGSIAYNKPGVDKLKDLAEEFDVKASPLSGGSNHLAFKPDESNPYFRFDPKLCVLCAACTRACDEVQGTFALTFEGRGFGMLMKPGPQNFMDSECVSCGACVKACPTGALLEKSYLNTDLPDKVTTTVCAYCGVGCSLKVETKGEEILRVVPDEKGGANLGHACVKGRFAWTYVTHKDRLKKPLFRNKITEPWKEISWEDAIKKVAGELRRIQEKYGKRAIAAVSSAHCTDEENYLMQKLTRAAFGNNNLDNCARICHAPSGFGLGISLGTGAGTQDFTSVLSSDVILVIGSNPTEAHPVVGAMIRRRVREGAKIIVIDPRVTDVVNSPHVKAEYHLRTRPGTNVAILDAMAHSIVKENLAKKDFIAERCDTGAFERWLDFIKLDENSPEAMEKITGVPAEDIKGAARLYATAPNASIFYGLGVTEHTYGSTGVSALANLAMLTGNIGRPGVGVSPLRGQNNVQGAVDMGACPETLPGYRHITNPEAKELFEKAWGFKLDQDLGMRLPDMFRAALEGRLKGIYILGEDVVQTDPGTRHVIEALKSMEFVVLQELFLNSTSKYAHMVLPGSSFLEKDGTFINWERRIQRVRKALKPLSGKEDWEIIQEISNAMGYKMSYTHPSGIMDEIARLTPTFSGVSYDLIDKLGSVQWPCNSKAPEGTPILHVSDFAGGKGRFFITKYVPTKEKRSAEYPLILTTVRNLYQYNSAVQTRRTANVAWYKDDLLEMNPDDASSRSINDGDLVEIKSRKGKITQIVRITGRVPRGVVCTTFHSPEYMTNILTTEYADWATETPEFKVTAVSVEKALKPGAVGLEAGAKPAGTKEIGRMANEVGDFFESYPEDIALLGIANHITRNWEPGLVERLKKMIDAGGEGLSGLVVKAFKKL